MNGRLICRNTVISSGYVRTTRRHRELLYTPSNRRGFSVRGKSILLIIGGDIAAYKSLELVRRLAECGVKTRAILTKAGAEFVTPLSVASLTGEKVYDDL